MQSLNRVRIDALIEAGFFERRADHNSSITSRHQVNLGSANHVTHDIVTSAGHGQHLSLDRAGREAMRGETPGPLPRAIHHAGRGVASSIGLDAPDPIVATL